MDPAEAATHVGHPTRDGQAPMNADQAWPGPRDADQGWPGPRDADVGWPGPDERQSRNGPPSRDGSPNRDERAQPGWATSADGALPEHGATGTGGGGGHGGVWDGPPNRCKFCGGRRCPAIGKSRASDGARRRLRRPSAAPDRPARRHAAAIGNRERLEPFGLWRSHVGETSARLYCGRRRCETGTSAPSAVAGGTTATDHRG
jgi:hypothetical protein